MVAKLAASPLGVRLTCLHLVDSHLCCDPSKYLAAVLLSLTTMLHLGLPHINVLSKLDLMESHGPLQFSLDFYTGEGDLTRLADAISARPLMARHAKLTRGLCEVVQDYGLVSFHTLDVQDEGSMRRLVGEADKCNGYVFGGLEREAMAKGVPFSPLAYTATVPSAGWRSEILSEVAERHLGKGEEDD